MIEINYHGPVLAKLRDHTEKLNIFLAVARAGSFHGAAGVLRLSQPSLSHAVQVLEGVIETQLFHRSRKGVQLTLAGEALLKFSERMMVEVDGIEQRIRLGQEMAGTLNAGTFASFVTYLWPQFLNHLSAKHKDLSINLKTLRSSEILNALRSRQCHFVVSSLTFTGKDIVTIELYRDVYGFFYSPSLLKKNGGKFSKEVLSELPLIFVPDAEGDDGARLDQLLWKNGIMAKKTYEVDTFEAVKSLALEGLGMAVLPLRLARTQSRLKAVTGAGTFSKKFGEHGVRAHFLYSDDADPRLQAILNELKNWSSR